MREKGKKEVFILSIVISILSIALCIFVIANYSKFDLSLKMFAIIIILCAVLVAVTGLIISYIFLKSKITEKKLKKINNIIYAQFDSVWKTRDEKKYIIVCKYKDKTTGKELKFKSRELDFNPESAIKDLEISTFPVYTDMQKKINYIIDIKQLTDNLVDLR